MTAVDVTAQTVPAQLPWATDALAQALAPLWPGLAVQAVGCIGSTNTELLARARRDAATGQDQSGLPALLVAELQTQGRGRQGKTWHAAAGSSLTFSLALPLAPADWSGLSLAVGLALAEAIDPADGVADGVSEAAPEGSAAGLAGARIGLKWPNDLLLKGDDGAWRKAGGILIETVPYAAARPDGRAPAGQRLVVIGIGLNLLPPPGAPSTPWGMAGLQALHPRLTAPALLARVAPPLLRAVLQFEQHGFAPQVAAYARRDVLHGRAVHTSLPQAPEGVADGVDAQGMLWLRQGDARQAVGSGEVSLRLAAAAQGPAS